jgi:hypothetical protein
MSFKGLGMALVSALLLAALLPAAATAKGGNPPKPKSCRNVICHKIWTSKFRVAIEGKQVTTWRQDSDDLGSCHGTGTQVVTFSTPGPQKVKMTHDGKAVYHTVIGHKDGAFPINASLQRSASWSQTGGCEPDIYGSPAVDCNASTQKPWQFESPYAQATGKFGNYILLDKWLPGLPDEYGDPYYNPFPGCPLEGTGARFPELLYQDSEGNLITAPLSTKKLLHSKKKNFTTSAHGVEQEQPASAPAPTSAGRCR